MCSACHILLTFFVSMPYLLAYIFDLNAYISPQISCKYISTLKLAQMLVGSKKESLLQLHWKIKNTLWFLCLKRMGKVEGGLVLYGDGSPTGEDRVVREQTDLFLEAAENRL